MNEKHADIVTEGVSKGSLQQTILKCIEESTTVEPYCRGDEVLSIAKSIRAVASNPP